MVPEKVPVDTQDFVGIKLAEVINRPSIQHHIIVVTMGFYCRTVKVDANPIEIQVDFARVHICSRRAIILLPKLMQRKIAAV